LQGFGDAEWAFPVWCELSFQVVLLDISSEPPNQDVWLEAMFLELWVVFSSYSSFTGFFLTLCFTSDFFGQVQLYCQGL